MLPFNQLFAQGTVYRLAETSLHEAPVYRLAEREIYERANKAQYRKG